MSFWATSFDWSKNIVFGDNRIVFENFILLKYFLSASICDSILIPKAIIFFGISVVLFLLILGTSILFTVNEKEENN